MASANHAIGTITAATTAGGRNSIRRSGPYDEPSANRLPTSASSATTVTSTARTAMMTAPTSGSVRTTARTANGMDMGTTTRRTVSERLRGTAIASRPSANPIQARRVATVPTEPSPSAAATEGPPINGSRTQPTRIDQSNHTSIARRFADGATEWLFRWDGLAASRARIDEETMTMISWWAGLGRTVVGR